MIKRGRWSSSISVDVDLDDVFIAMDKRDRENMADWLYDEGYLDKYIDGESEKNLTSTVNRWSWKEICDKLANNQL
jgi:hypothetical protein